MIGNIHNQDKLDTIDNADSFSFDPAENDLDDLAWLNGINLDSLDDEDSDFDSIFFVGTADEDSDDFDWLFGTMSYSTESDWSNWNYIPSSLDWLNN